MCGITAYYSFGELISKDLFALFTDSIEHRGMDGRGYYYDSENRVALGHTRLSIIDLSDAGKQPMHYLSDRYTIVYNGEIFNYRELRDQLKGHGYTFVSNTDTEVILAAYDFFGSTCVEQFNGMWAFVIYDRESKSIFASRDRFGIKPFYYYYDKSKLIIASETIAFRTYKDLKLNYNLNGISNELHDPTFLEGNNQTFYSEISCLPAGHNLTIGQSNDLKISRWWKIQDVIQDVPHSFSDQVEKFRELFIDAIKLRLRSDVKIGTALSGGLDSSSIYCTLNKIVADYGDTGSKNKILKAYVATFNECSNDETKYALKVINEFNNDYKLIEADTTNLVENIERSILKTGVITGTSLYPVSNLYAQMKLDGTTVSLDGHGADEQLYGYTWLVLSAQQDAAKAGDYKLSDDLSKCYLNMFEPERREIAKGHLGVVDYGVKRLLKNLRGSKKSAVNDDWLNRSFSEQMLDSEKLMLNNFTTSNLPSILRNFDRASMQAGVEIRMPFMDYRLVCFLNSIPITSKLGNGYTKRILREAMKGVVPDPIRLRTYKLGINAPLYEWFNAELKV